MLIQQTMIDDMLMLLNKLKTASDHSFSPSLSSPGTGFPILLATSIYPLADSSSPITHLRPPIISPILTSSHPLILPISSLPPTSSSLVNHQNPSLFPYYHPPIYPTNPLPPFAPPTPSSLPFLLVHHHLVPTHPTFLLPMAFLLPFRQNPFPCQIHHRTDHILDFLQWRRNFFMRDKHKEEG